MVPERPIDPSTVADLVIESLRGRDVRERCRQSGIPRATFYRWRSTFVEAGRARLADLASGRRPRDTTAALREALRCSERERGRLDGENMLLRARLALQLDVAPRRSLGYAERRALMAVVRASRLGVRRAVRVLGVPRSTFYAWRRNAR